MNHINNKGFVNIVLIVVLVLVLAGALGYITLVKKPVPAEQFQSTNFQNTQPVTPSSSDNIISSTSPPTTTSDAPSQTKSSSSIIHLSGPMSRYGNGTFWGNDPISFVWWSDHIISPIAYLSSPTRGNILTKILPRGKGSSAKFGESFPVNKNLSTGSYKIVVCEEKDVNNPDVLNNPHCVSSTLFTITATTTPFQP